MVLILDMALQAALPLQQAVTSAPLGPASRKRTAILWGGFFLQPCASGVRAKARMVGLTVIYFYYNPAGHYRSLVLDGAWFGCRDSGCGFLQQVFQRFE